VAAPRTAPADPLTRLGLGVWRVLTSVNFAVLQIIVLGLLAVIGMTLRQLPGFAFRSPGDYAIAMDEIHARYDPAFGRAAVDLLEGLQLFQVFSSTWFSLGLVILIVSIVACTVDRTPRLWRQCAEIRVVQPEPFFDPRLPDRAVIGSGVSAGDVRGALRRRRFTVREASSGDATFVYGDRNRWSKLATLLTHLGLILFLVAAAVTSRLGDEQGLVVAEGETLTVQPIGTPGLLLVRNLGFEAPGFETGQATDFTTDLAVYQHGVEVARKTIRVNDPLAIAGYTFHQNGFGPAPDLVVSDPDGDVLWTGPVPLTDQASGLPFGVLPVPGRDVGLQMLLTRADDGRGIVLVLPYRVTGELPDGSPDVEELVPMAIAVGETQTAPGIDFAVGLRGFSDYTILIAKHDPGLPFVWAAFALLIAGLVITFHLPRRRIWARLAPDGRLSLVARSERFVDQDREFARLVDELVAARAG
jgi:cytochrome c biogenesis protein